MVKLPLDKEKVRHFAFYGRKDGKLRVLRRSLPGEADVFITHKQAEVMVRDNNYSLEIKN